ncbi:hypothetical protein ACKFKF_31180 [Phormidesmis sp. 146-12]
MADIDVFAHYRTGMAAYEQLRCAKGVRCHLPTLQSQWVAFSAELKEFAAEPSLEEAWDILHSFGRLVWRVTGIPLQWLAYPTVRKHGRRFAETGCIRSRRNCEGRCCLQGEDDVNE